MSVEAHLFNGFGWNSHDSEPTIANTIFRIRTTGCMRTRQSPYKIVGHFSDKGGHRYQQLHHFILRMYWLAGV